MWASQDCDPLKHAYWPVSRRLSQAWSAHGVLLHAAGKATQWPRSCAWRPACRPPGQAVQTACHAPPHACCRAGPWPLPSLAHRLPGHQLPCQVCPHACCHKELAGPVSPASEQAPGLSQAWLAAVPATSCPARYCCSFLSWLTLNCGDSCVGPSLPLPTARSPHADCWTIGPGQTGPCQAAELAPRGTSR